MDSHAPAAGVSDGKRAYFFAYTRATGYEPWVSDGTAAGTYLLKDTFPGRGAAGLIGGVPVGSNYIIDRRFTFLSPAGGGLWIASEEATTADRVDLNGEATVSQIGRVGSAALVITRGEDGFGLWRVEPATGSETLLYRFDAADFQFGMDLPSPPNFTEVGGRTYFAAWEAANGVELWATDGTQNGTYLVADLAEGAGDSRPIFLTESGGKLYFLARGTNGSGLWVVDAGAMRFVAALPLDAVTIAGAGDGGVYLMSSNPLSGQGAVSYSDGTPGVIEHLFNISSPGFPLARATLLMGDTLFAEIRRTGNLPTQLWSINRATRTFHQIETAPGRGSPELTDMVQWGDRLAFAALDANQNRRIWVVRPGDSLPSSVTVRGLDGTSLIQLPGTQLLPLEDFLLYAGYDETAGRELMGTDISGEDAGLVANIASDQFSIRPRALTATKDRLYFVAATLWASDGTAPGTLSIDGPVNPGALNITGIADSSQFAAECGGRLVFFAENGDRVRQIWVSDGTVEGTNRLLDTHRAPYALAVHDSRCYFTVGAPGSPARLWTTDGSENGTRFVAPLDENARALIPAGDLILSVSGDGVLGSYWSLHATDPANSATDELARFRLPRGVPLAPPARFARANGLTYFAADDFRHGQELWVTDGTVAGTRIAVDINPGRVVTPPQPTVQGVGSAPQELIVLGNRILFFADDGEHGFELWSSDGTPSGSGIVLDIVPGPGSPVDNFPADRGGGTVNVATQLVAGAGRAFFVVNDRVHGAELWVTDGSTEGTELVRDIMPGRQGSNPSALVVIDGVAVFSACGESGCEVWTSDGTEAGTFPIADVYPGPLSSSPSDFMPVGDIVYFAALDDRGDALWAFPRGLLPPPAPTVPRPEPTRRPTLPPPPCVGDCDGDNRVAIAELVRGVAINLGMQSVDDCPAMDVNGDGRVAVNELIAAVRTALEGCDA